MFSPQISTAPTISEADQSDAPPPAIDSVKTAEGIFDCQAIYKCSVDGDVYVRYPGLHKEKRENVECNYDDLPSLSPFEVARRIAPELVYERSTKSNRFIYKCPFENCNKQNRRYLIRDHMGGGTCSLEGQALAFLLPEDKSVWPAEYQPIKM